MLLRILLSFTLSLLILGPAGADQDETLLQGLTPEETFRLGERMYRDGILPSGEPMQAIVMGDIPVDGRMFTCDDCHQRSGLGSVEGTVITWPTNGKELFKPRRKTGAWRPPDTDKERQDVRKRKLPEYYQIENARPAYTDETLARVLRIGIDPAGRKLSSVMPLYLLNDRDMAIMINYLRNLSVEPAPGVDEKTIRFATVVTDGVSPEKRQTMLTTLQTHIDVHNAQSRHQEHRAASGPFYKTEMHQAYRRMQLDVWELHGPEETWSEQLEEYYRNGPVFGLLGGIAAGSWRPIHEFCERNKVPCIFPLTDLPVVSETAWYTLYLSKGFYQEGETAARYLHLQEEIEKNVSVIIVTRDNLQGAAYRHGFSASWRKFGRAEPEYLTITKDRKPDGQFWQDLKNTMQPDAELIVWLESGDLEEIGTLAVKDKIPARIILSAKLLDYSYDVIPDNLRDDVYLTYPSGLPDTLDNRKVIIRRWLETRNIPPTDLDMQARIYFLGWMLPGAIKYMRSEFFREYFLEGFDMMIDQDYAVAFAPRLSFGPGQRYAAKGCYIVQISRGDNPKIVKKSDWVIF